VGWDIDLERDVLAATLREPKFVRRALPVLRRHAFSNAYHAFLWDSVKKSYTEHHELPSMASLLAGIDRRFKSGDECETAEDVLLALRKRRVNGALASLDEIKRVVRMSALRRALGDAFKQMDLGEIDETEAAMAAGVEEARGALQMEEPTSWATSHEERLASYLDRASAPRIKTPMATLNERWRGGIPLSQLMILLGSTHAGKSTIAAAFGLCALVNGCAVAHITTEEPRHEAEARYDAGFTRIERNKLLAGDLAEGEREMFLARFKHRGKEFGTRLRVLECPPGSSVSYVQSFAEELRIDHPDVSLVVIVDSADHMRPVRKAENFRLETSSVYYTLRAVALDLVLAPHTIITTCNAPRNFEGRALKTWATGESYDKAKVCSTMLGIEPQDFPADDEGRKPIEFVVLKDRINGALFTRVATEVNYGICDIREMTGASRADDSGLQRATGGGAA